MIRWNGRVHFCKGLVSTYKRRRRFHYKGAKSIREIDLNEMDIFLHEAEPLPKLHFIQDSKSSGPSRTTMTKDRHTHIVLTHTCHAHYHLHRHICTQILLYTHVCSFRLCKTLYVHLRAVQTAFKPVTKPVAINSIIELHVSLSATSAIALYYVFMTKPFMKYNLF